MALVRRLLLPAVLAAVPAQIALVAAFGIRPVTNLLDDPVLHWIATVAWLGGLIVLGYVTCVLPAAKYLAARKIGRLSTLLLLSAAVAVGGAVILMILFLPAIVAGGSVASAFALSLLGSMVGLIALGVWLPLNWDVMKHPSCVG